MARSVSRVSSRARRALLLALAAASVPALPRAWAEPPAEGEVFYPAPVLRLRIELPPESVAALANDHRAYARGTLREGDRAYRDVGLRLKGSAGSFQELKDKPGLTVKLNRFNESQRFHGLRKLILNNGAQDPTYLSELIGNELFRAAGVPAPRNGFARVEMNGRDLGLYVISEAVTHDFLSRWFADPSGNLYEGPGEINDENLDLDSRGGLSADRSDLRALAAAASEREPARRMERLEGVLDANRFLSFLAMEALTCHWDGYTVGVNNFHLYHNPTTGRMVFIPHGMDQLFQQPDAPLVPRASGLLARAVLRAPEGRRRYLERVEAIYKTAFNVPAIQARVREAAARIRPTLAEIDPGLAAAHDGAVRGFLEAIAERANNIRGQLARKGEPEPRELPLDLGEKGVAKLRGWEPRVKLGEPKLVRMEGEGSEKGPALKVLAQGPSVASWRARAVLLPGRYRFSGRARVEAPEAGRNEALEEGLPAFGAGLRISGQKLREMLQKTQGWTQIGFEFTVEGGEGDDVEPPLGRVELVCELGAVNGAAWFDEESLLLERLRAGTPTSEKEF